MARKVGRVVAGGNNDGGDMDPASCTHPAAALRLDGFWPPELSDGMASVTCDPERGGCGTTLSIPVRDPGQQEPPDRLTCYDVPLSDGRTLRVGMDPDGALIFAVGDGVGDGWRERPREGVSLPPGALAGLTGRAQGVEIRTLAQYPIHPPYKGDSMSDVTEHDVELAERLADALERATEAADQLPTTSDVEAVTEAAINLADELENVGEAGKNMPDVPYLERLREAAEEAADALEETNG